MKLNTLSAVLLAFAAQPAAAASFTVQPLSEAESKDTKVYASVGSSNFSSNLNVVSPDITDFRGLVQFNLSSLAGVNPGDVSNVSLRLYATGLNLNAQSTATSATVSVLALLSDWKETAADAGTAPLATWDNLFGSAPLISVGAVVDTQSITATPAFYDWNITALAKSWLDGSRGNFGLLIQAPGPLGDVGIADVDSSGAGFGPALIVTTVPEPGAAGLALAGGLLLGRRRRR